MVADYFIEHVYDSNVDALFINVKEDYVYEESVELNNNIILDFDKKKVVAFEILDASKFFEVPSDALKNIKRIQIKLNITDELIALKMEIIVKMKNDEITLPINSDTLNNFNVSPSNLILTEA